MAEQKQTLLRQEPQNGTGQAFRTGTPESAGIPSEAVEWLLDELESGFTEPHGIMIMRNDILCAEGYWSPFAPGVIHGEQSHSKTYAATGIGIAYTEGLLSLDERLIDIFPEYAPAQPSENLKKLTIRNVLRMSCGMEKEPAPSKDWIRDFLAEPVVHEPGTAFMYNSTGSSMLAAIVRKKTGMGLHDYLNDKLYRKIGIDGSLHRWMKTADGIEIGGGGLFATLRDNFRLMKLYADGGVWNGERILAEDFVKEAVSKQIDTASEAKVNPPAFDNFVGYGYQIWQCQPAGVYRADGAMGQFTIIDPARNLEIAIMENASGAHWAQKSLDVLWEFLEKIPETPVLPEKQEASERLSRRLRSLSLPAPAFAPASPLEGEISGRKWHLAKPLRMGFYGIASLMTDVLPQYDIYGIRLTFRDQHAFVQFDTSQGQYIVDAAMDGTRQANEWNTGLLRRLVASAYWENASTLRISLRFLETCGYETLTIRFPEPGKARIDLTGTIAFHPDQTGMEAEIASGD